MLQSPNYIHFRIQWQVLGPDSPGQCFDRQKFQSLMNSLNSGDHPIDFDDFSYRATRCEMAKVRETRPGGGTAFTKLVYANDLFTLTEEWAEISTDDFAKEFVRVLGGWFEVFPETLIVAQRCTLRALVQPSNYADSREFVGDRVLGFVRTMQPQLKKKAFKVGFNVTCTDKVTDHQLVIDAMVNSWRDNKTVWLQVQGGCPMAKPINAASETSVPERIFDSCRKFLEDDIVGFLNLFDQPDEKEEERGGKK